MAVSRETPATHLARLKVSCQSWRIERDGNRFTAVERGTGRHIVAATVGELETALAGEELRQQS